jgi:hypothetical protein
MASIELDFDVWKELTLLRTSEEDTYSDVIRALLRRNMATEVTPLNTKMGLGGLYGRRARGTSNAGIIIPNGTEIKAKYKGKIYIGSVKDNAFVVDGHNYSTFSAAAHSITNTNLNGWYFWECRLPGQSEWKPAWKLRDDPTLEASA